MDQQQFFDENGKQEDIISTGSGLQYKVLTEGSGKTPQGSDRVRVHYAGKLLTGEEFDSSYTRGQPAEFPVNGVIRGWVEALQLMKEGSKWEVYIPSTLGYGAQGAGGAIPPNAGLIFTVELIKVL